MIGEGETDYVVALIGAFTMMSGLLVWVVKHMVARSDAHLTKLIGLLEQSVVKFIEFEEDEKVVHQTLTMTQTQIVEGQKTMVTEFSKLTVAVDKLCLHVENRSRG